MSTFENIGLQQAPPDGLSDPLTVGLARRVGEAIAYLRGEVWITRFVIWCGFAGAVLLQAGLFSLFGRLVLMPDTGLLPSVTASVYGLTVGVVITLGSRALSERQPIPSVR